MNKIEGTGSIPLGGPRGFRIVVALTSAALRAARAADAAAVSGPLLISPTLNGGSTAKALAQTKTREQIVFPLVFD